MKTQHNSTVHDTIAVMGVVTVSSWSCVLLLLLTITSADSIHDADGHHHARTHQYFRQLPLNPVFMSLHRTHLNHTHTVRGQKYKYDEIFFTCASRYKRRDQKEDAQTNKYDEKHDEFTECVDHCYYNCYHHLSHVVKDEVGGYDEHTYLQKGSKACNALRKKGFRCFRYRTTVPVGGKMTIADFAYHGFIESMST